MRVTLFASLLGLGAAAMLVAACGGVSEYPPGSEDDGDAGVIHTQTDASPPLEPTFDATAPIHSIDASLPEFDSSFPHTHDAAVPHKPDAALPEQDAGPIKSGTCPASCTEEPAGVPPCTSPERTCNCTSSNVDPKGCTAATGLAGIYCCGS
jgi:hypothetical protein